jgi:hypothetical protein
MRVRVSPSAQKATTFGIRGFFNFLEWLTHDGLIDVAKLKQEDDRKDRQGR